MTKIKYSNTLARRGSGVRCCVFGGEGGGVGELLTGEGESLSENGQLMTSQLI